MLSSCDRNSETRRRDDAEQQQQQHTEAGVNTAVAGQVQQQQTTQPQQQQPQQQEKDNAPLPSLPTSPLKTPSTVPTISATAPATSTISGTAAAATSTNNSPTPSPTSLSPTVGGGGAKATSASIFTSMSTKRNLRKTPAFSITVPERETVAMHVQGPSISSSSVGKSGEASAAASRGGSSHSSPKIGGGGGATPLDTCESCGNVSTVGGNNNNNNISATNNNNNNASSSSRLVSSCSSPSTTMPFSNNNNSVLCTPTGYHERNFSTSAFHATRLLPLLYLGSEGDAGMPDELRHRNIRRVLNVAFDCAKQDYSAVGIEVMHVPLRDCGDEDIMSHFDRCCRWIHEGITKGHGVIVHCRLGVSRSATIAIAYLMTYGISSPTRVMSSQNAFRVTPIAEQKPQGYCRTCKMHGRIWHQYEDNAERINRCEFHTHPQESEAAGGEGRVFTDYNDVFAYVSMRREHISPNLGFAMQLRKLNVEHGFRDFFADMSPSGPSDDYCCMDSPIVASSVASTTAGSLGCGGGGGGISGAHTTATSSASCAGGMGSVSFSQMSTQSNNPMSDVKMLRDPSSSSVGGGGGCGGGFEGASLPSSLFCTPTAHPSQVSQPLLGKQQSSSTLTSFSPQGSNATAVFKSPTISSSNNSNTMCVLTSSTNATAHMLMRHASREATLFLREQKNDEDEDGEESDSHEDDAAVLVRRHLINSHCGVLPHTPGSSAAATFDQQKSPAIV